LLVALDELATEEHGMARKGKAEELFEDHLLSSFIAPLNSTFPCSHRVFPWLLLASPIEAKSEVLL
jgi:hypothetical protein